MKLIIVHMDKTEECHEAREHIGSDGKLNGYLDGGITAVGFQFYSETLKNYVLIHPKNVFQIRYE